MRSVGMQINIKKTNHRREVSDLRLPILFVVVNFNALAQASDFESKGDKLSSSAECRIFEPRGSLKPGSGDIHIWLDNEGWFGITPLYSNGFRVSWVPFSSVTAQPMVCVIGRKHNGLKVVFALCVLLSLIIIIMQDYPQTLNTWGERLEACVNAYSVYPV